MVNITNINGKFQVRINSRVLAEFSRYIDAQAFARSLHVSLIFTL